MTSESPDIQQPAVNPAAGHCVAAGNAFITGMGAVCSLGPDTDTVMDTLFGMPPDPAPPERFSTDHPVAYPVFSLPKALEEAVTVKHRDLTLTAGMAVETAKQALDDAGLSLDDLKGKRVGVCMGTTVGCALNNDPFYIRYREGKEPGMEPILRFFASNPAEAVARALHLDGPVQTVANACASGSDAIGIGAGWLASGLCDLVIAGGTDELCKVTYNGFSSLMITDHERCRPFDAERRGLNLGEGAAALVMEPESDPERARCRLDGYGAACDAYHLTAPRPDAGGLKRAVAEALNQSGLKKSDIGFINAHGTGTRDNDRMEMTLFKEDLSGIPFFSTKGYTGHTLGAAGALEAVITIGCLESGKIPPSIGFTTPDPETGLSPVTRVRPVASKSALSLSVAFGGNNAALVFTRL